MSQRRDALGAKEGRLCLADGVERSTMAQAEPTGNDRPDVVDRHL